MFKTKTKNDSNKREIKQTTPNETKNVQKKKA